MRNAVFACILVWVVLITVGCATISSKDKATSGQVADVASTVTGLALGAVEANPLGIATLAAKVIAYDRIKKAPEIEQPALWSAYGALGWGATANNVCVIALIVSGGTAVSLCSVIGIIAGVSAYQQDETQRHEALFNAICRVAKKDNAELVCVYN
jgi:hypothetical protein